MRYIGREITLAVLVVCAVLSQVGSTQQLQPLLAAVAAGLVIENLAVAQGDMLRAAVRRGAPPVLVVFFVAVGASLRLDAVAVIGAAAWRSRWCGSRSSAGRERRVQVSKLQARRPPTRDGSGVAGRHHARLPRSSLGVPSLVVSN